MLSLLLHLPSPREVYEHRAKILACAAVFFFAAWMRRGEELSVLKAQRAAVESVKVSASTKDVKRGPVKRGPVTTTKKTTIKPDGTKEVETTRRVDSEEVGAIESHSEVKSEERRKETPVFAPEPWRAFVLELQPLTKHTAARLDADLGRLRLSARHELPFAGRLVLEPWIGVGFRF